MRPLYRDLVAGALVFGLACGGVDPVELRGGPVEQPAFVADPAAGELGAAKERWAEAGMETYHFIFKDDCGECDPIERFPRLVAVWGGAPASRRGLTIEEMFETIEKAITEGESVDVEYDPALGNPTAIILDAEAFAYDGGTHWQVRGLKEGLPGNPVSLAALEKARQSWEEIRPHSYEFTAEIDCDCPAAGTIWTQVDGGSVVDWRAELDDPELSISPITIDEMFDDIADLISTSERTVEAGVGITGSATYHPELGYLEWVGLDVDVIDPESDFAWAAPRMVISVVDVRSTSDG